MTNANTQVNGLSNIAIAKEVAALMGVIGTICNNEPSHYVTRALWLALLEVIIRRYDCTIEQAIQRTRDLAKETRTNALTSRASLRQTNPSEKTDVAS